MRHTKAARPLCGGLARTMRFPNVPFNLTGFPFAIRDARIQTNLIPTASEPTMHWYGLARDPRRVFEPLRRTVPAMHPKSRSLAILPRFLTPKCVRGGP
jgi:hypothetical protein